MPIFPSTLELAQDLVAIPSSSDISNADVAAYIANLLELADFRVEELAYIDGSGARKVSLVARKGHGKGGLGLFCHSDTVPGDAARWDPFRPAVADGRLIGRGACDMKGPLAAALVAAADFAADALHRPLTLVISADEEVGYGGAIQVAAESQILRESWPEHGVITEPTCLVPVHAHKGGVRVNVTAHGRAAHTSTDLGISANFLIAPFLAEMAELNAQVKRDPAFMDGEFTPPTIGFNMVVSDGDCKPNVTAAKTVCTVSFRPMPISANQRLLDTVVAAARRHSLEVEWHEQPHFYVPPETTIVQTALAATAAGASMTVPYGTEAAVFSAYLDLVVLGAGDIAQAHTVGEWIDIAQLERSVAVYARLIAELCGAQ
jgi:acetylornithine deacetylase